MQSILYRATFILLGIAWFTAIAWFISNPGYHQALMVAALLATITGIFGERWFSAKERRAKLFALLAQEIQLNILIITNPPFKGPFSSVKIFYPRLFTNAADMFFSSADFIQNRDKAFLYHLLRHRQVLTQVNRKLSAIELRLFLISDEKTKLQYHKAITDPDGPIAEVMADLANMDFKFKEYFPHEYSVAKKNQFGAECKTDK